MNHNENQSSAIDTAGFFNSLYGKLPAGNFVSICTAHAKGGFFKPDSFFETGNPDALKKMAQRAQELNAKGCHTWHNVNCLGIKPENGKRGTEKDVSYQTAIVADIDIKSAAHAEENLVESVDEALATLPLKPTFILYTGYGIQPYWLFDTPIAITNDNRAVCKKRNEDFLKVIAAKANGKKIDGVANLDRILRTLGTKNYKLGIDNAPTCHIIEVNDVTYTPEQIDSFLADFDFQSFKRLNVLITKWQMFNKAKGEKDKTGARRASLAQFVDDPNLEDFRVRRMLDFINPAALPYDDWLAVGMALKNAGFDCNLWTLWSRADERFKEGECEYKWGTFNGAGYTIGTIYRLAEQFGYNEKNIRREYSKLHPDRKEHVMDDFTTDIDFIDDSDADSDSDVDRADSNSDVEDAANTNTIDYTTITDEQRAELFSGERTDRENGDRIAQLFGDQFKFVTNYNQWLIYKNGVWLLSEETHSAIYPFARKLQRVISANAKNHKETSLGQVFDSAKKLNAAIQILRGNPDIRITSKDLDTHNNLLNCLNCVVDLETGKTYDAAPECLITRQTNAAYYPDLRNETVEKFLRDIMPNDDDRAALIRWLGYCLTGEVSEQCAHFWTGAGSNGKSTLLEFILNLMGSYATKLSVKAIVAGKEADANATTTHLNVLAGARLAVVDEFKPEHRLDAQSFKSLTGDTKIDIRRLHKEREIINMTAKLTLNGNELPKLDNLTYALQRRIKALRFTEIFSTDRGNLDIWLPKKLAAADALSGMLTILIDAAKNWYANSSTERTGLLETNSMLNAKLDYFNENDFIEEFISENCTFKAGATIMRKDFETQLKLAFPTETSPSRIRPRDLSKLIAKKLETHGATLYKDSRNRQYTFGGVGWENEPQQSLLDGVPVSRDDVPF